MKAKIVAGLCLAGLIVASLPAEEPEKTSAHEVPYRLSSTKHLVVRVKLNGKGPFNFIIDTGAPAVFVSDKIAARAGVKADKTGWGTFDRFDIEGGVRLPKTKTRVQNLFQLEGMNGMGVAGIELHGVIGFTLLARFKIEYDLTKDHLVWTPLKFNPAFPRIRGKAAAPAGLDALGSVLKVLGAFMGRKPAQATTTRGFWGVELADSDAGVEIKSVLKEGPAAKAGLKAGDHIMRVGNRPVKNLAELLQRAAGVQAGASVDLSIRRDDKTEDITLETEAGL